MSEQKPIQVNSWENLKLKIFLLIDDKIADSPLSMIPRFYEFRRKAEDEVFACYIGELVGLRKPFFIEDLKSAIEVFLFRRLGRFRKEKWIQDVISKTMMDEYLFSSEDDLEGTDGAERVVVDIARSRNTNWFGEPVYGLDKTPEEVLAENELRRCFEIALEDLYSRGRNGPLYYEVINFYLKGLNESMNLRDELNALAEYLGIPRENVTQVKFQALRMLYESINRVISLDEFKEKMKQTRRIKKRFRRLCDEALIAVNCEPDTGNGTTTLRESIKSYSEEEITKIERNPSVMLPLREPCDMVCKRSGCRPCTNPEFDEVA